MTILNCRVFRCKFNDKGKCRLETITLQDVGSPIIGDVLCIESGPKDNEVRTLNKHHLSIPDEEESDDIC